MAEHKFLIQPHFRLHEWIAEEKGYFTDEGLDYDFQETVQSTDGKVHAQGDKVGAMQSFEKGRTSESSCACHWTVNVAAAKGHGKLYGDAYSVSPFTLFSGPYYFAEQLGFRKIIDCTFMMATMITGDPDPEDVRKFFRALKRAQRDLDLRPELYTHFYKNEFPKRYHAKMDTRRWGPGERIVFEPYSQDIFEESRDWIRERGIFEGNDLGKKAYDSAVVRLAV